MRTRLRASHSVLPPYDDIEGVFPDVSTPWSSKGEYISMSIWAEYERPTRRSAQTKSPVIFVRHPSDAGHDLD